MSFHNVFEEDDNPDFLTCRRCSFSKPVYDFPSPPKKGKPCVCLKCKHPGKETSVSAKMIYRAKIRAKKLKVPFNLTEKDILPLPICCPILGVELKYPPETSNGKKEHSASLDRLRPELGYVKGNVVVISFRANRIKSDANLQELKKLTKWLSKALG